MELRAETRWQAIDELVEHLVTMGKIRRDQRDVVIASVRKRESAMTTGIGHGIGLPHAAVDCLSSLTGAWGRSAKGIQFESLDKLPVHFVALFLVPRGEFHRHLDLLANLAKWLRNEGR